jgi:lipoprotein NlpD
MMRRMTTQQTLLAVLTAAALASCSHSRVVRPPAQERADAAPAVRVSQPKYGAVAVVQRGQTVYRIATENGITALDLALWNAIPPPYTIYPGQRLRLYPGGASTGSNVTAAPVRPAAPAAVPSATSKPPAGSVAAPVVVKPTVIASTLAWQWPADGSVVATFVSGNPTRQGVDIAGKSGQPVRAAADGVVVYSGSGLVGYGELVIVKHDAQWLTAYGHNRARLVNEGALVKAGQQIAEMGRSGASRDMLHFEIRQDGKPVDPQLLLPKR